MSEFPVQRDYATYQCDSTGLSATVAICPDGPVMEVVIPAPMMSESDRYNEIVKARNSAYLSGYYVEDERRVRNPAFDKRGEKTSTILRVRPCRNEDEAFFVGDRIASILGCSISRKNSTEE